MRTVRSFFGVVAAAIPVLYCGGFLLYFAGVRNAFGGWLDGALGPTMIGLGVIGLLFLIPLVLRIRRLVAPAAPPAPPRSGGGRADDALLGERGDFDPEAAIARYMAKRPSDARGAAPTPVPLGARPVRQSGFGRRGA